MQKTNVMIILILNEYNRESYEDIKKKQIISYTVSSDQGFKLFSSNELHVTIVRVTYSYFNVF